MDKVFFVTSQKKGIYKVFNKIYFLLRNNNILLN